MKTFSKLLTAGLLVFAIAQLVRPGIPTQPATAEIQAPDEIRHILEKDCFSCHSNQRRLAWFDQVVPAYWLVRYDILTAREHLNFSQLGSKPAAVQRSTLFEAVNMIQMGAMPLPRFVQLHPDAKVTPKELATLKAYLAPWNATPPPASPAPNAKTGRSDASTATAEVHAPVSLANVKPEPGGFAFDASFEDWKPISTTDRGDNNTFRFILGNDTAVQAIQSGNITPWPDGARLAKIAWQQESGADGLVHPGKFVQVEMMLKGARSYKDTEGWAFGRWRGADLKPYGDSARFVHECTTCHQPARGNDFVYTLPITSAKVEGNQVVNNTAAALPPGLPYQPLDWGAITMYVDPINRTTATLYGNDAAMQAVKAHRGSSDRIPVYPAGAVLALVSWAQRDDPHWFGARIPNVPQSVEFVDVAGAKGTNTYRRFAGSEAEQKVPADSASQRTSFILGLAPAWLP